MLPSQGHRARRPWSVGVAALALAAVLGTLGFFIAHSQQESRNHLIANFKLRASASATLVSTYIAQQAVRERESAEQLMSVRTVTRSRFRTITTAFGAKGAVLLDSSGRVISSYPARAARLGESLLRAYPKTRQAEEGKVIVSDVLPAPHAPANIAAIAVPFQTPTAGRRVFAAAYLVGGTQLSAFVDRTIAYKQHEVLLIDSRGSLLASSPRSTAASIQSADPPLAAALAARGTGSVPDAEQPSTFTVAGVPGTPWRMVLMVPNSKLFATISGTGEAISWLVFALVTLLGALLVMLLARSLADRSRLAVLSAELESIARTDSLTGLLNRRGVEEDLARACARARREDQPITALMIDLDHFKQVNDRYGHEAGDRVLMSVAACMCDALRAEDIYGRVGGDEFLVAMPAADERAGRIAAARLESFATDMQLPDLGLMAGIPMSIGVASGVCVTPEDLMRAADAELYRVKARRAGDAHGVPAAAGR